MLPLACYRYVNGVDDAVVREAYTYPWVGYRPNSHNTEGGLLTAFFILYLNTFDVARPGPECQIPEPERKKLIEAILADPDLAKFAKEASQAVTNIHRSQLDHTKNWVNDWSKQADSNQRRIKG